MDFEAVIFDWQGVLWKNELNKELINWIKSNDNLDFALLTNCRGDFRARLKELKIATFFEVVENPNSLNAAKPDTKAFEMVLNKLDVDPEKVVFIDDSYLNVKTAQNLNIQAVHYRNNNHLFKKIKSNE